MTNNPKGVNQYSSAGAANIISSAKSRHGLAVTAAACYRVDATRATTTAQWLKAKKKEG